MAKFKPLPPLEKLQEVLSYDPETGVFTWVVTTSSKAPAGSVAGSITQNGYRTIWFKRKPWYAHRIAWLFGTGKDPGSLTVDHINRDSLDNRFKNLRLATSGQQNRNRGSSSRNKSGIKGVSWDKARNKWVSQIQCDGKERTLGRFVTKEEAAEVYQKAATALFGEFMAS